MRRSLLSSSWTSGEASNPGGRLRTRQEHDGCPLRRLDKCAARKYDSRIVSLFRRITVLYVVGWLVEGVAFVSGHAGVGQLGPMVESFVAYWFVWRCANCRGSFGSTVKLVLSDEEKRARRDPALALVLSGVVALWEMAIILIAPGSQSWLTYAAMLGVIPVVIFIAFVSLRRADERITG
jgi:hypothetical protein